MSRRVVLSCLSSLVVLLQGCSPAIPPVEAVELTLSAAPELSGEQLASIRLFQVVLSGSTVTEQRIAVPSPFATSREERLMVRPSEEGEQTIEVVARNGLGHPVGYGQTTFIWARSRAQERLRLGTTIPAKYDFMLLPEDAGIDAGPEDAGSDDAGSDDAGSLDAGTDDAGTDAGLDAGVDPSVLPVVTPGSVTLKRGEQQTFSSDLEVSWSVLEPAGGTITDAGVYSALTVPGRYTIVAARTDYPQVRTTVSVQVEYSEHVLLAGAVGGVGNADGPDGANSRFAVLGCAPAVDANGNLYLADRQNHVVRRVDSQTGAVTTVAGRAGESGTANGVADARLLDPYGTALDTIGATLFIAEANGHSIRKVNLSTGEVSLLAGQTGTAGDVDDPDPALVRFRLPTAIVYDEAAPGGPSLWVGEYGGGRVRQVNVQTGATSTGLSFCTPQGGSATALGEVLGLALSTSPRRLLVADASGNRVCSWNLVNPANASSQVASGFGRLTGLALSGTTVFTLDFNERVVRTFPVGGGPLVTLAGTANAARGWVDATGAAARFSAPEGLAAFGTRLYVADGSNTAVRTIDTTTGVVSTIAGLPRRQGNQASLGADGATARFNQPIALASDEAGNLYVADRSNHRIWRVAVVASGSGYAATVSPLAGSATGAAGFASPTPVVGSAATFNAPACLTLKANKLYVCDFTNGRVRVIDLASPTFETTSLVAVSQPRGLAVASNDDLYITTQSNQVHRYVAATGSTQLLFGQASGLSDPPSGMGVDGVGLAAYFSAPTGVVLDETEESLFVADTAHQLVRRVELRTGLVTTVAGQLNAAGHEDGAASVSKLSSPYQLAWGAGALFISELGSHVIRRYDPRDGMLSTVAGQPGSAGVQLKAAPASLNAPTGLAFLPDGELVVSFDREDALVVVR